jgi:PTS system nitrogen regulatory IIA component
MPDETFDIASLSAFLQMMPTQVARLAERGKLPARRVAGNWVFSRPEIGHWLEGQMGSSDDAELAVIEKNLRRVDPGVGRIDLAELMPVEAVAIPLAARTHGSVITAMAELAAGTGMLWDAPQMAQAVSDREAMGSTAVEHGVALLHPRRPQSSILGQAVIALGITSQGIPFGGPSGLTDVFFLIAAVSDHQYLRILARLSRIVYDPAWLDQLRSATDADAARQLILERDASIALR